ncbi:MAG TPA: 16S rRNA (cytidine(1402)-2'-O)-methyltransferase [Chitinophagales bacterium]|nr:16S rRNA (cytidine(1402)-2'-O)-methyltransferase [Chitinophagales bacterium]
MPQLFIIPTPIGNLEDVTLRALRILKEVDVVIAEDTRTSGFLLKHFGIEKKILPHHKFNERSTVNTIIDQLKAGKKIALLSDAGTPGISDPGELLIKACTEQNIPVECLPGATALIPALVISGFATSSFVFEGFLPRKKGRQAKLKELSKENRTILLYESPHRIKKTIEQSAHYFGNERRACICRELTKLHEEVLRGSLGELKEICKKRKLKGEMVVVIEGKG